MVLSSMVAVIRKGTIGQNSGSDASTILRFALFSKKEIDNICVGIIILEKSCHGKKN
jgi:hypothetical protein